MGASCDVRVVKTMSPLAVPCSTDGRSRSSLDLRVRRWDRLEPLIFVLRRLIECVATPDRVCMASACHELELGLELEGGGRDYPNDRRHAPPDDGAQDAASRWCAPNSEARPPIHAITKLAVAGAATRIAPTAARSSPACRSCSRRAGRASWRDWRRCAASIRCRCACDARIRTVPTP